MANSRSNIYPVQLQGAELNLNKFDAEIKQYSGFNKNNSPFVGGCLSNLFTKTEENTTGSSDSVYVDDNGDVYIVDKQGLYKNGNKILAPKSGNINFEVWDFEELEELPGNTVFAKWINEKPFYITKSLRRYIRDEVPYDIPYFTFHYKDKTYDFLINGLVYDVYFDVDVGNGSIVIAAKTVASDPYSYTRYYYFYIFRFDLETEAFSVIQDGSFFDNGYDPRGKSKRDIKSPPIIIFKDNYFYILWNYGTFEIYNGEYNNQIVDQNFIAYALPQEVEGYDTWTFWGDFIDGRSYVFGKDGYIYLIGSDNDADYSGSHHTIPANTTENIIVKIAYTLNNGKILVSKYASSTKNNVITGNYGGTSSAITIDSAIMGMNSGNFVVNRNGCSYGLKFSDNKFLCGVCDFGSVNVTLEADSNNVKQPMFYMGGIIRDCILTNNGVVSGLTLPGGKILATEWNSVDADSIDVSENEIVYKNINNNRWYRIFKTDSKPRIKNVNGQLVLNINQDCNCYKISNGKLLTFATGINNRACRKSSNYIDKFNTAVTDNTEYMAVSVNEYALEDNASILLNPLPVIKAITPEVVSSKEELNNLIVTLDIYTGSESEILYKNSAYISSRLSFTENELFVNQNLMSLPFPIDTNGNLQLSPSLFCTTQTMGNDVFIKEGDNAYQLIKNGAESVMSYYLGTLIENLEDAFVLQGQYYTIINKQIFNVQFSGGVVQSLSFVVSVENLQFCGNSVYQAYFFSKTNRCLYTFSGANMLSQVQLVDKIPEIYAYKYNQSTQSIILITDIGTLISSNLGMYLLENVVPDNVFFYRKGVVFVSDSTLTYLQYYPDTDFIKHNIELETCFYGMNNETVTINDCLYLRLFSEEHEEGEVKVSATTISLRGRKTEETIFRFKASDWDKLTHSVYVRYQPKEQRGLGISFSINSPFKISSLSVGSKADAILVDKVSKGAVITPSNNDEW